ncbi:MAG: anthranilate phosphoribosyltransferase [Proteobacteria bacterium]|nr:anthranilate phosphoribosyltransferase [Pseudomonadota bacterium]
MKQNAIKHLRPVEIEANFPPSKIFFDRFCAGQDISRQDSELLFDEVIRGLLTDIEITALLVALKIKGETPEEIAGAASILHREALDFDRPSYLFADSAGTGGDGALTFNISTAAAFAAAACGLPMAKHGNRSVSSRSGSADVLEALGAKVSLKPDAARACLDEIGFTFLYAPLYHQAVKNVGVVRKELKTRTVFNILGPLVNPAHPPVQLVGVYAPGLCRPVIETLKLLGCRSAMVVHGSGVDEVALHGPTEGFTLKDGKIRKITLTPEKLGLEECDLSSLEGGSALDNARIIKNILSGYGGDAQGGVVAANAGVLLYLAGLAKSIRGGVARASRALSDGSSLDILDAFVRHSIKHGGT